MGPSPMGEEGSGEVSDLGSKVVHLVVLFLKVRILGWDLHKGACSELHGDLMVVRVEDSPTNHWSTLGKLVSTS